MENSIEEDIKIVENYLANSAINEIDSNFFKNGGWETVDLEIPESMQHILSDYKRVLKINEVLLKKNEILKEEKEQAWEEWNNLERGSYEAEQKLKQQIKELQKKNEELKKLMAHKKLYTSKLEEDLFENASNYVIKKPKVKDKIEHYQKLQHNYIEKYDEINEGLQAMINVLQELLESEDSKDGEN